MTVSNALVIGVDCATQPSKTGLVRASWKGATLSLEDALVGSKRNDPVDVVTRWIGHAPSVLLALDAPLGWPRPLVEALENHEAGEVPTNDADNLFSRSTDRWIRTRLGKRPLEVGANLIARTAHSALKIIGDVRQRTGLKLPLVWSPGSLDGAGVIEVYPAATRIARGISSASQAIEQLSHCLKGDLSRLGRNPHVHDAAWCAVAGADYLARKVEPPPDIEIAKLEGWIWVHNKMG